MLNRTQEPPINQIENIAIIKASAVSLANGIPVYTINAGTQDLIRIEFLFKSGFSQQQAPLVASTTNDLLDEGTSKSTALQIADNIDYYGAFLETEVTHDFASINLFTLNKHQEAIFPVIEELIKDAIFPEQELSINLQNRKQKHAVNNQKVNTLARNEFSRLLFGNTHPYGYYVELEDFDRVKREQLLAFFKHNYVADNCSIIISGNITPQTITLLEKHFGGTDWKRKDSLFQIPNYQLTQTTTYQHFLEKPDAVQSAIRIGRNLFNKTHHDYQPMQVLNTILGGYFGSRLMSNIREDKGYTYGIGSGTLSYQQAGCFYISTEVGVDVCSKAVHEIYKELDTLREELVDEDELALVRNYMLGSFLSSIDGPFALADRFKGILVYGLDYGFYENYIHTIKTVSAVHLRDLANMYLQQHDLIELVVGKK